MVVRPPVAFCSLQQLTKISLISKTKGTSISKLGGAGEACLAHNQKDGGSKPPSATEFLFAFI